MAKKYLSIEMGERIIQVAVFDKKGKNHQLTDSFLLDTPMGAVSDGQLENLEALENVIYTAAKQRGIAQLSGVTFVLTSSRIASREVSLPKMNAKRIKSVVTMSATEYFPVDLTNYHIAHSVLDPLQSGDKDLRVMITAVPRPVISGYIALATKLAIPLQAIDFVSNSHYQALRQMGTVGTVMNVKLNSRTTLITFMRDNTLLLQRSFPFGGDDLLSVVSQAASLQEGNSVQALSLASDASWLEANTTAEQRNEAMERLLASLGRSLDFFKSTYQSENVEKIVIMGDCASICGIRDAFSVATGLPTSSLADVPNVIKLNAQADQTAPFIGCIGSMIAPLELIPEDMINLKKKTDSKKGSVLSGTLLFVASLAASAYIVFGAYTDYMTLVDTRDQKQDRLDFLAAEGVIETYDSYVEYNTMHDNFELLEANLDTPNNELRSFFEELELKMPSDMMVFTATCTADSVSMNVEVPSMEVAAVVISQLRSFNSIDVITVSSVTEEEDELGIVNASFSIVAEYAEPVEETEEATA